MNEGSIAAHREGELYKITPLAALGAEADAVAPQIYTAYGFDAAYQAGAGEVWARRPQRSRTSPSTVSSPSHVPRAPMRSTRDTDSFRKTPNSPAFVPSTISSSSGLQATRSTG